jgi:hypothetical protein
MWAASYSLFKALSLTTALLGIKAHGVSHDDWCRTGDGNETHLELGLFQGTGALSEGFFCSRQWKEARNGRGRSGRANCLEKCAAKSVIWKQSPHETLLNHTLEQGVSLLVVLRYLGFSVLKL